MIYRENAKPTDISNQPVALYGVAHGLHAAVTILVGVFIVFPLAFIHEAVQVIGAPFVYYVNWADARYSL